MPCPFALPRRTTGTDGLEESAQGEEDFAVSCVAYRCTEGEHTEGGRST